MRVNGEYRLSGFWGSARKVGKIWWKYFKLFRVGSVLEEWKDVGRSHFGDDNSDRVRDERGIRLTRPFCSTALLSTFHFSCYVPFHSIDRVDKNVIFPGGCRTAETNERRFCKICNIREKTRNTRILPCLALLKQYLQATFPPPVRQCCFRCALIRHAVE